MRTKELREFVYENGPSQIGCSKENSYYSAKRPKKKKDLFSFTTTLIEKIPDPNKTKEHYQSYLKKKTKKISKTIENNCSTTEKYRKPKHCWHKIIYYKTSKSFL